MALDYSAQLWSHLSVLKGQSINKSLIDKFPYTTLTVEIWDIFLVYVRILTSAGSDDAMYNYSPLASLSVWT
jgi:hypothetical protein